MNDALYVAASGLSAIERMLENATHNTINAQTPGYQTHRVALTQFGAMMEDAGLRSDLVGVKESIDFKQGELRPTNQQLDLGLDGEGFFKVRTPKGNSYFTRNGAMTTDSQGTLITHAGYQVLDKDNNAIVFDTKAGPINIARDGLIKQGLTEVATLGVYEFKPEDRSQLLKAGETMFRKPDEISAQRSQETTVNQGFLEMPENGGMNGLVNMLVATKNYESMNRSLRTMDSLYENLIRSVQ